MTERLVDWQKIHQDIQLTVMKNRKSIFCLVNSTLKLELFLSSFKSQSEISLRCKQNISKYYHFVKSFKFFFKNKTVNCTLPSIMANLLSLVPFCFFYLCSSLSVCSSYVAFSLVPRETSLFPWQCLQAEQCICLKLDKIKISFIPFRDTHTRTYIMAHMHQFQHHNVLKTVHLCIQVAKLIWNHDVIHIDKWWCSSHIHTPNETLLQQAVNK